MIDKSMLHLCDDCDNEDCELRFMTNENVVDCEDHLVLNDDDELDDDEFQEELDFQGDDE